MKSLLFAVALSICSVASVCFAESARQSLFDFKVKDIEGKDYDLAKHKGKVTLILKKNRSSLEGPLVF